jgi:hypothetical protein
MKTNLNPEWVTLAEAVIIVFNNLLQRFLGAGFPTCSPLLLKNVVNYQPA